MLIVRPRTLHTRRSFHRATGHNERHLCVTESAYEDEEQFARGGITPGESVVGEEDDGPGGGGTNFPLRMAADTARGRISAVGGFFRGAGQHVNFDPEAPPPPLHLAQQTTGLLERPEVDKKVKVLNKHKIQRRPFGREQ